jgi:elongation factor Tu
MGGNFDAITAAGLKQAASAREADPGAFSMTILDVFEIAGRGVVVTGRVDAGTVRVGDTLCLLSATSGERELQVEAIELGHLSPDSATAGDTPAITFNGIGTGDVSRNDQLRASCGSR